MNSLDNEYFEWLSDIVCHDMYAEEISYRKLLMFLHGIEFRYTIPKDENRAEDGLDLRYRFCLYNHYDENLSDCISGPCSVLEMIIALAIRCEENIMDDPSIGDRTTQWFWGMISNLGLGYMTDIQFDKVEAANIVNRFLDRRYEPNGKGGLFYVRNCNRDLRDVEIWYQLCWYLNTITDPS